MNRLLKLSVVALGVLATIALPALAGGRRVVSRPQAACPNGQCARPATVAQQTVVYRTTWNPAKAPTYATPSAEPTLAVPATAYAPAATMAADPLHAVNKERVRMGLGKVKYNADLSRLAQRNSLACPGQPWPKWHLVLDPRSWQIVANASTQEAAVEQWRTSIYGHKEALYHPRVTEAGIAYASGFWTVNLR